MEPETKPLISIVTPSFNQVRFIRQAIESVQTQEYPRVEHIVVDGGSTDGTIEVLEQNSGAITWVSEPDRGQTDAINKGFRMAHGEILTWLNSDDMYLPGTLETIVRVFNEHPDVDLVYGDCDAIDENGAFRYAIHGRPFDRRVLLDKVNFIEQPATFFRRRALDEVGPLDESLHYTMDFDLWLRMSAGHRALYIPARLAACRKHSEAKTTGKMAPSWESVVEVARLTRRYGARPLNRNTTRLLALYVTTRLRLRGPMTRLLLRLGYEPGRAGRSWDDRGP